VHAVGVVPQRHPGAVEHVRRQAAEGEPGHAGHPALVESRALAVPARHRQEEGDAPAAGHVVHDVGQRHVLGLDVEAGLVGGDPDRALHDRLPAGQLARGRLVGAVAVTGVGPLPQQDALLAHDQKDDVYHDPATLVDPNV
jgi:hypothetical protein